MSSGLMEPGIEAALDAGRVLIVPGAQRAAALRWNWARVQLARGRQVWDTPQILTWDAWLELQWEQARLAGRVAAATRRLNRSQQLQLWRRVLDSLEGRFGDAVDLAQHAAALMDSAVRAVQWQLPLTRLAVTDEERLLAVALHEVRQWCRQHDCSVLALCTAEELAQFVGDAAPLILGQPRLTALQAALAERRWSGQQLLPANAPARADVQLRVACDLEQELRACARWCGDRLAANPGQRLLVISAASQVDLLQQGTVLARELCAGTGEVPEDVLERGLVAVEGGRALSHQQLIADALAALRLLRDPVSFDDLACVLRSPYFDLGGSVGEGAAASQALLALMARAGLAHWPRRALDSLLASQGAGLATASALRQWRSVADSWRDAAPRVQWAHRFSQWLGEARFARAAVLDSREAQRLVRWSELLDEFAALDALAPPLELESAAEELADLAAQARHAASSGDAAITLTADTGAPLARYDGIWVLGLAEQRWPPPPRPDPYVPLSEQRRCEWEMAGARQRLEQARWSLLQWQGCAPELVLSHPLLEGDVHHRPSALPGLAGAHSWRMLAEPELADEPFNTGDVVQGHRFTPMATQAGQALRRGQERLRLQQACAFRGQAEIRLHADAPASVNDGVHPAVRGVLLHGVLDGLWRELGEQRSLLALDEPGRAALFERHWARQVAQLVASGHPGYPPRVLERERLRSLRLVLRVLAIEAQRPGFRVLCGERSLPLATPAGVMTLRVDRLDEDETGQRWLIDYKSGAAERFGLAQGDAQPLQLALYEQALAEQGESIHGMALLSLAPAGPGFAGAAPAPAWPGKWQRIDDWEAQRASWRAQIRDLLRDHVDGVGQVAPLRDACRHCHLAALCRRADVEADAELEVTQAQDIDE